MHKRLDSIRLDYEKEMSRLQGLQCLVKHFENNNEEYLKVRKTAEEKVVSILSDAKRSLKDSTFVFDRIN
jgi:hypothetical protein